MSAQHFVGQIATMRQSRAWHVAENDGHETMVTVGAAQNDAHAAAGEIRRAGDDLRLALRQMGDTRFGVPEFRLRIRAALHALGEPEK